jgi:hypothetical protein
MAACPIHKKAKKLFENISNRLPFAALSVLPEEFYKPAENADCAEITNKESKSGTAGQNISRDLDLVNIIVAFTIFSATLIHEISHLMGFGCVLLEDVVKPLYITISPKSGRFF